LTLKRGGTYETEFNYGVIWNKYRADLSVEELGETFIRTRKEIIYNDSINDEKIKQDLDDLYKIDVALIQ
jgi:hypothetical protein